MKDQFSFEELNLMAIYYKHQTRDSLLRTIQAMRNHLNADTDDLELLAITDSVIKKLDRMSDIEYAETDFSTDYDE